MQHQSWNKAKRWFLWLGGCAIVLILAVCGFWYWINVPPQVKIPAPIMPQPNGYDYFLRAGAAFVPDEKGVDETTDVNFVEGKKYPLAPKEAWLKQNAKALQLLREGLKYQALYRAVQPRAFSKFGQFRDLSRALAVESHVRAERGDWSGAADSALDGLEFGCDIARGGPLIAGLASNAVQAISLREMYHISPHLDAKAAKHAAKRMEYLLAAKYPYFKTMHIEKWGRQAVMLEQMKDKSWRRKTVLGLSYPAHTIALIQWLDSSYSPPSWIDTAKEFLKYSKIFFISNKTLMKNYTRMMDAYIANGQISYIKMQPIPASKDPLVQLYKSSFKDTRWNWARMDAYNVLNMTMLALRAFHLEKGHYPSSLKELVPEYLKKIPEDPFIGNAPLHYQLKGQKYLLWSIGPDGVDNHGTPIINRNKKKKGRYRFLYPDSKGDVVAGINVP